MKTASEEITEIRTKLISDDWVSFAGNRYDRESWQARCEDDWHYSYRALLQFLDQQQNKLLASNLGMPYL